jgi:outer membrane putative beta-barrel porin/alpha-amylase
MMGRLSPLIAFVASVLLGLWPLAALAQDINPDRPDLTTSAEVVPAGALQLETGLEYERERSGGAPTRQQLTVQAVLRAGLATRLEVSLEGEPFIWQRADDDDRGSGDYTLALKYRLYAPPEASGAPALALRPFVKLPVARAPIGSERLDVGALLLMSLGLPWGLGLDVNAGAAAIGQTHPDGFIPQGVVSASFSWAATDRLTTIADFFFATKEERDGRENLLATVAVVYKVTPLLALDAGMRTTLAGPGPDWSAFVGLSARFGR